VKEGEFVSFVPVAAIDAISPSTLYAATNSALYRSDDHASTWRRLGSLETRGTPMSIAVSPADRNVVWTGTTTGRIYLYEFAREGTAGRGRPTHPGSVRISDATSPTLPNRTISDVVADPADADTAWVVFTGYEANTTGAPGKVFVTRDRGRSWTNISSGLPDLPISALAVDPTNSNRLWAGTDGGVWVTTDGGASWTSDRQNMPVVSILDLHYNVKTGYLTVATHGRGVWRKAVGSQRAEGRGQKWTRERLLSSRRPKGGEIPLRLGATFPGRRGSLSRFAPSR
jgi:photosystem II stability/assembly factor-like uncharacterized protein